MIRSHVTKFFKKTSCKGVIFWYQKIWKQNLLPNFYNTAIWSSVLLPKRILQIDERRSVQNITSLTYSVNFSSACVRKASKRCSDFFNLAASSATRDFKLSSFFLKPAMTSFVLSYFLKEREYLIAVRQLRNFLVLQVKLKRFEQLNVQRYLKDNHNIM